MVDHERGVEARSAHVDRRSRFEARASGPSATTPMTPLAGPEISVRIGRSGASAALITPPSQRVMNERAARSLGPQRCVESSM